MTINKKMFICALMVLMIVFCINTVSAENTLDAELTSVEASEPIAIESVDEVVASEELGEALAADSSSDVLSASGDIIYVDPAATNANAAGTIDDPCQTIKKAVAKTTGGETIFLKNGIYTGNYQNGNYATQNDVVGTVNNKVLNIVGESRDGVIIDAKCNSFSFISSNADFNLTNITFKTMPNSLNVATLNAINIKGTANANIINCSFTESGLKKAIIFATNGNVLLENFTLSNNAIVDAAEVFSFTAATNVNFKNAKINDNYFQKYTTNTEKLNYLFSISKAAVNMENVEISNNNMFLAQNGLIYLTSGASLNMVGCKIKNNTVSPYTKTAYPAIFYVYGTSSQGYGSLNIQQSVIADNKDLCYIFKKSSASATVTANYNNIHNNTLIKSGSSSNIGGNITANNAGAYDLDNNWWGSNVAPTKTELGTYETVWKLNSYVIDSGDYNYVLNDSSPLEKTIPELPGPEPTVTDIEVIFIWADENNQDGVRPVSVSVDLLADGVKVDSSVLSEDTVWTATFNDLLVTNDGVDIEYTLVCDVENYTNAIDFNDYAFVVTLTHEPAVADIEAKVLWDDAENQDGFRPENVYIDLLADGVKVDERILNISNEWLANFEALPVYNDGKKIEYTINPSSVVEYTFNIEDNGNFVINYTHEPEVTDVTVVISWEDAENQDGLRPENVYVVLLADGVEVEGYYLNPENDWKLVLNNLNMYKDGVRIVYTVLPRDVDNYTNNVNVVDEEFDIEYTHEPAIRSIKIVATFEDVDDLDGIRPMEVWVDLLADGAKRIYWVEEDLVVYADPISLNEANAWEATFINLPVYKDGVLIEYSILPNDVEGYAISYVEDDGGYVITYTHDPINNIVTQDNFFKYFDEYGILKDEIPFDELIFKGEFSDLVTYINLERAIKITGEDAVLNDIAFIIAGTDVTLDNMKLVTNADLGNLIDIAGANAVISNMNISYVVSEYANAINVYPGADNVKILNNSIYFESTVEDYTADDVSNAICVNSGVSLFDDEADPILGLVIDGNNITAVIPAFFADNYEHEYYVMGLSAVNGVRINGAEEFEFTNNNLDVTTNHLDSTTPTYQALYVASSSGLIDKNNISMIDTFTPEGTDVYLYAIEIIYDEDLVISNNNFNLSTKGGKDNAGAAYAVQAVDSIFNLVDNNITTVSNGPNIGVYLPSKFGAPCDLTMTGNIINVTGLATSQYNTGLVSGIEVQTGDVVISQNIIYTKNIGDYAEDNYMFGISYAQTGSNSGFEIVDNEIYTDGHYAISLLSVNDAVITDNYLMAADLYGDDAAVISAGSGNVIKNNRPFKVNLTVSADNITYGKDAVITVSYNSSATGIFTVLVNDEEYPLSEEGIVIVPKPDVDVYTVKVTFNPDNTNFVSDEAETTFNVTPAGSNVVINPIDDVTYNDAVLISYDVENETSVSVVVKDSEGNEVVDGVDVSVAGQVNVSGLVPGDYTISITNIASDCYYESSANASFTVLKAGSSVVISTPIDNVNYGSDVVVSYNIENETSVSVVVKDSEGNEVVDGVDVSVVGTVTVSGLVHGDYTIEITNAESDLFTGSNDAASFTVVKAGSFISVDFVDDLTYPDDVIVTYTVENETVISAVVMDEDFNVVTCEIDTNVSGQVTVSGLVPGKYNIVVYNAESELFFGSDGSTGFRILPANSSVVIGPISEVTYPSDVVVSYTVENETSVSVVVKDSEGNEVVDGVDVSVAGQVTISGLTGGDYTISITNAASDLYSGSDASAEFTINKIDTPINIVANNIVYGDVLIVNIELPADVAFDAKVTIGDETKDVALTEGKGSVEFTGLTAGVHDVVVDYAGDDNYNNASANTNIKVDKASPSINVVADDIVYGEDLVVNVELSGDVSRRAVVVVDDESKYVSLTNGVGSVKFSGLTAGTHEITASYNGDSNYVKYVATTEVKVNKATPAIKITAKDIKAGEDLVVNVELSGDVSRRAVVVVGDESKYVSLTNGVGSVKFSGLSKGTYTVTASYNGDSNYGKSSSNITVNVNRGPVDIQATVKTVSYGEDVVVDIQVPSDISRRVNVTIGNETKLVKVTNGTVSVKFSGLEVGAHDVVVSYNGDENYLKSSLNLTANVVRATPDIQITTNNITAGEALTVEVQLPADVSRRAIVKVGDLEKLVSLKEGIGTVKFTDLEVGTYDVIVSYDGDVNFKSSSNSTKIEVIG